MPVPVWELQASGGKLFQWGSVGGLLLLNSKRKVQVFWE